MRLADHAQSSLPLHYNDKTDHYTDSYPLNESSSASTTSAISLKSFKRSVNNTDASSLENGTAVPLHCNELEDLMQKALTTLQGQRGRSALGTGDDTMESLKGIMDYSSASDDNDSSVASDFSEFVNGQPSHSSPQHVHYKENLRNASCCRNWLCSSRRKMVTVLVLLIFLAGLIVTGSLLLRTSPSSSGDVTSKPNEDYGSSVSTGLPSPEQEGSDHLSPGQSPSTVLSPNVPTASLGQSPGTDLSPNVPTASTPSSASKKCFSDREELLQAIDVFLADQAAASSTSTAHQYGYPMSTWCVDKITSFGAAFSIKRNPNASQFQDDISTWNTTAAVDMTDMFRGCELFNAPIRVWDVSQVKSMRGMFHDAKSFNQDLENWNVSQVQNMRNMFRGASSFAPDSLDTWNVGQVRDMWGMFWHALAFNARISSWDVRNVLRASDMFRLAKSFQQDLVDWDWASAEKLDRLFLSASRFAQDLCAWRTRLVPGANVENMFKATACPIPLTSQDGTSGSWQSFCFDCSTVNEMSVTERNGA